MDQPRMQAIGEATQAALVESLPYLSVIATGNLMDSVVIRGAHSPKEDWPNSIFQNARYFIASITPQGGKRYYDDADAKVTVEVISSHGVSHFRKYTGPVAKVIANLQAWINNNKTS